MSPTIAARRPAAVDYERTLILSIELSNQNWVLAAQVPGLPHTKAKRTVDPEAEEAGFDKMTSIVTIRLTDGRTITGRAQFGKGSPADPMSFDEVADKFRGCTEFAAWPKDRTEAVIYTIRNLEEAPDVRRLAGLLSAPPT